MSDKFIDKIKADLQKSGLSTELQVQKKFTNRGWHVSAGCGYLDLDSDKHREIDIDATRLCRFKHNEIDLGRCEFHICGEVKYTKKNPWVVFKQETKDALLSCAWNNLCSGINFPEAPAKFSNSLSEYSPIKLYGFLASGVHELGSVLTLTDGSGSLINKYDYTAFGESYAGNTVEQLANRYTYTGREKSSLASAGVAGGIRPPMYYRWRSYSPQIGRFLWRDPIGYEDGVNIYVYVENSPIVLIDSLGLQNHKNTKRIKRQGSLLSRMFFEPYDNSAHG